MASNFIGPRMCPRLLVALTQTPFVWAVRFILLHHEDKLFCRWLLNMIYLSGEYLRAVFFTAQ